MHMNGKIKVAFDTIKTSEYGDYLPLNNLQELSSTVDIWNYEFFKYIENYELIQSNNINDDDIFVYPIHIMIYKFNKDISLTRLTTITNTTLDKIKFKNGYILIDVSQESLIMQSHFIDDLHNYLTDNDIPYNKVILQHGGSKGDTFYEKYCINHNIVNRMTISNFEFFEFKISRDCAVMKINNDIDKINIETIPELLTKDFLCLNNVHNWNRSNLLLLWYKNDLLKNSYYSFRKNCPLTGNLWSSCIEKKLIDDYKITTDDCNILENLLPLVIDNTVTMEDKNSPLGADMRSFYQSSLISIVNETSYNNKDFINGDIFNTEKIFKPILYKHPFILVGSYKALSHLKEMGYKTFSDFFDEDYDDIEDPVNRLIRITQICKDISIWNKDKKIKFINDSKEITEHNKNLFLSIYENPRDGFWNQWRTND